MCIIVLVHKNNGEVTLNTTVSSPVTLTLEQFREVVEPSAEKRVLVRSLEEEALYLFATVDNVFYITHIAGLYCSVELFSALSEAIPMQSSGLVEGYFWKTISGGPPASAIGGMIKRGISVWNLF